MRFIRLQKADGSSNHLNVDGVQMVEATDKGQGCILHMIGGNKFKSGVPADQMVEVICPTPSNPPRKLMPESITTTQTNQQTAMPEVRSVKPKTAAKVE